MLVASLHRVPVQPNFELPSLCVRDGAPRRSCATKFGVTKFFCWGRRININIDINIHVHINIHIDIHMDMDIDIDTRKHACNALGAGSSRQEITGNETRKWMP